MSITGKNPCLTHGVAPCKRTSRLIATTLSYLDAFSNLGSIDRKLPSIVKRLREPRLVSWAAATMIRLLGRTIRVQVEDRCGVTQDTPKGPLIWLFWHNRVFLMPYLQQKVCPQRRGRVLTSSSRDGEIIARIMRRFGHGAVRGSSNKRPAAALREMVRMLGHGDDIAITPDGPRGPRYQLQQGAVKLAQLSGCPLMCVHVTYTRAWRLKTWDQFVIPKPFTSARLTFDALVHVPRTLSDTEAESIRASLEASMRRAAGDT